MRKLLYVVTIIGLIGCTLIAQVRPGRFTTMTGTILTMTGFGTHTVSAGGTGANTLGVRNTTAGTGNYARFKLGNDASDLQFILDQYSSTFTTAGYQVQDGVLMAASGPGGISLAAQHASGALRFYAGGATQRWGVNAAGDWTVGTSANLADSAGTPTIAGGFGAGPSIAGRDYAFKVTLGTGATTGGTVALSATYTNKPICTANPWNVAAGTLAIDTDFTAVIITMTSITAAGGTIYVICRGY